MTVRPARAALSFTGPTLLFTTVAVALALVACGGGGGADAAPAKTPAQQPYESTDGDTASEPRTIEEAQDRIARARAALEARDDSRVTSEDALRAERPEPPAQPQGGASPRQERENACGSPCRALASMRRAVDALCRMTGDADERCIDARRTLGESTSRVASCRCDGQ